ncbi:hypothetical protein [[Mycobacterium] wendilense]|uniref:Uncharacterized protein n=1 Tax=[Mycobacterium] wendilense TaxID=3064284 RepID=A0ABM9MF78_9MYCO|nr:hypothetical protein [Mycolicibacterium sp. MU0050]CAJ1583738.1 hypothetical protein MU0050_002787 [Mycolicibacterium sp. MU0050]
MLTAVAIIPSAPVLVPQLAGTAADELGLAREAVLVAAAALPARWIAVGVGPRGAAVGPSAAGTFAGYGVDVPVRLSLSASEQVELPLCALITGWVRGLVAPDASAAVRCVAADAADAEALDLGARLRAEIDAAADPVGVLLVADGANTLSAGAPGGHDPGSVPVQERLDEALAGGNGAALRALPAAVVGRAAFAVLAGLLEAPGAADEFYRGAPYGVGYFAGVWRP